MTVEIKVQNGYFKNGYCDGYWLLRFKKKAHSVIRFIFG